MGRADVQQFVGSLAYPPNGNAPARENERMLFVFVDKGQLKVRIVGGGGYRLPHLFKIASPTKLVIDLHQMSALGH
jgi:hypothetical protein